MKDAKVLVILCCCVANKTENSKTGSYRPFYYADPIMRSTTPNIRISKGMYNECIR